MEELKVGWMEACEDAPGAGRAEEVDLWPLLLTAELLFSPHRDHLRSSSLQVLLGAGAAPRLDAHVVFCSHSSDRDRHSLPAARPKGDHPHPPVSEKCLISVIFLYQQRNICVFLHPHLLRFS